MRLGHCLLHIQLDSSHFSLSLALYVSLLDLKLLHLDLDKRILHLLLSLLHLLLTLCFARQLSRRWRNQLRNAVLDIFWQWLVWRWQRHTQLFFHALSVFECQMLLNVGRKLCLCLLRVRTLGHNLHDLWILEQTHVSLDVCLVILVDKRLNWLSVEQIHVFTDWIGRLHVCIGRYNLISVTNT